MSSIVHILNGGALAEQWPDTMTGEVIVMRECLVEGPVQAESWSEFRAQRDEYLSLAYPESHIDYPVQVAGEFERIRQLSAETAINLWFEDDLFCQVNLWFVCHLLEELNRTGDIRWVRPQTELRWGFGGVPPEELADLQELARPIDRIKLNSLAALWRAYRGGETDELLKIAANLGSDWTMVHRAAEAHRDRVEHNHPNRLIREIIAGNPQASFGKIFQEFSRRAPIYGFGDLQVKRLHDAVLKNEATD